MVTALLYSKFSSTSYIYSSGIRAVRTDWESSPHYSSRNNQIACVAQDTCVHGVICMSKVNTDVIADRYCSSAG